MLYKKSLITGTLASLLLTTNLFAGNCVGGVCHINLDNLKPRTEHAEHIAFTTTKQISAPTVTTVNMIEEPILTVIASPIIEEQIVVENSNVEEISNNVEFVIYNDTPELTEDDQDLVVMIDEVDMENQVLQQSEDYCEETTHLVYNLDADVYECV